MNLINKSQVYNCLEEGHIVYNSKYTYLGTVSKYKKMLNSDINSGAILIIDDKNNEKWISGFVTHCFKKGFIVSNLKYIEN